MVNGLDHLEFSVVAQWIECPPSVWEIMGSIPIRDSDFSLSHPRDMLNISSLTKISFFKNLNKYLIYILYSYIFCRLMA